MGISHYPLCVSTRYEASWGFRRSHQLVPIPGMSLLFPGIKFGSYYNSESNLPKQELARFGFQLARCKAIHSEDLFGCDYAEAKFHMWKFHMWKFHLCPLFGDFGLVSSLFLGLWMHPVVFSTFCIFYLR